MVIAVIVVRATYLPLKAEEGLIPIVAGIRPIAALLERSLFALGFFLRRRPVYRHAASPLMLPRASTNSLCDVIACFLLSSRIAALSSEPRCV
jgi:hypothetical protein